MPIYEYRCDACKNVFEEWRRHADDITEVPCPECHTAAHRLISNTSFVLKGGGWYVTEYGNRKTESSSGAASDASTGTSGNASSPAPEAKTETAAANESAPPAAPAAKTEATAAAAS